MSILKDIFLVCIFFGVILYLIFRCNQYRDKIVKQRDFFINMLGHDIKVPLLAQVRGMDLLKKSYNLTCDELLLADEINNSCKYTLDIITMLAQIYKIENKDIKLNCQRINISNCIVKTFNDYIDCVSGKNINLNIHAGDFYINADKEYFVKALKILVYTVIQYSYKNSAIDVYFETVKNELKIIMNYNGNSITDEEYNRMFDLNPNYSAVGNGIKMYLCKKIIDIHAGCITVNMGDNGQNSFILTIPEKNKKKLELGFSSGKREKGLIFKN